MNRTRSHRKKAARLRRVREQTILKGLRSGRSIISTESVDKFRSMWKRFTTN